MTYVPDHEERLKGLDNLFYEVQQLLYTTAPPVGHSVIDNALLESRLIHVRTLLDVFAYAERDKDVVVPVLRRCKEFIEYLLEQRAIFHEISATAWRQLAMEIQAFLDSPAAR